MRKTLLAYLVVLALMGCMICSYNVQASNAYPTLSFNGTTASCKGTVMGSGSIEATLELWSGSTKLTSWSDSGTGFLLISETYSVSHGVSYTLKLTGTVGGVAFPESSVTKVCP